MTGFNKVKKKPLSQIVSGRMLTIIMGTFIALMVVTFVFVYRYAENSAKDVVRFSLEDINNFVTGKMDWVYRYNVKNYSDQMDMFITEDLAKGWSFQEVIDALVEDLVEPGFFIRSRFC